MEQSKIIDTLETYQASGWVSSIQIMQVRVQNKGKSVWKSRYDGDVSGGIGPRACVRAAVGEQSARSGAGKAKAGDADDSQRRRWTRDYNGVTGTWIGSGKGSPMAAELKISGGGVLLELVRGGAPRVEADPAGVARFGEERRWGNTGMENPVEDDAAKLGGQGSC